MAVSLIKNLLIGLTVVACCQSVSAQKASDVIENGHHIKTGRKLFLQYLNGEMNYDVKLSLTDEANPPDFTPLDDSLILLVNKNAVNVYITPPLNPLNYSFTSEIKEIPDPINEAAATGLGAIIELINSVRQPPAMHGAPLLKCDTLFNFLKTSVNDIKSKLEDNRKKEVLKAFTALKSLSFNNETQTIDSIAIIKTWMSPIERHYLKLDTQIVSTRKLVKMYDCGTPERAFTIQFVFMNILKEADDIVADQKIRLKNLQTAFNLVQRTQREASVGGTGLKWCIKLPTIPSKGDKIYLYNLSIKKGGYRLSDENEIVSEERKDVLKRNLRVRKYQLFVPEVSIGTAYTSFQFNIYGTTTDSTGQQYVGTPTEKAINNLNITTMLNFNAYIENSPLHPFYQLGIGVNSGIPTLLTGLGIRSNINGIRRLAISGGIAMTWIQELDQLKVGDKVSGTTDIDQDLQHQFTGPKLYIGVQYNF